MGQADVIKFLEKHSDKWFTIKELREKFKCSRSSMCSTVNRLAKHNEIKKIFTYRRENSEKQFFKIYLVKFNDEKENNKERTKKVRKERKE
ncbi:MAG: hypothetical protein ACOCRX_04130 [Candidatus Woesearchaeota archaeon]